MYGAEFMRLLSKDAQAHTQAQTPCKNCEERRKAMMAAFKRMVPPWIRPDEDAEVKLSWPEPGPPR